MGVESCRSFKPFPNKLVCSRFPPAPAACRQNQFCCSGAAFLFLRHGKRVGTDSTPRGLQEGPKRALRGLKKSPLITRSSRCSLIFHRIRFCNLNIINQCLLSLFLDRKRIPMCLQKSPRIARSSRCSLIFSSNHILQPQHHKSMSPLGVLGQKESPDVSPKEPSGR